MLIWASLHGIEIKYRGSVMLISVLIVTRDAALEEVGYCVE